MDILEHPLFIFALGALSSPVLRLLRLAYRKLTLRIKKIIEKRNSYTRDKDNANEAVRNALKAWRYVEVEYEEFMIKRAKAYGGRYPTTQDKIEQWENVVAKCNEAARLLEQVNKNIIAKQWKNNAQIASRKIKELEKHPDTTTTFVVGMCEATRRELEGTTNKNQT